MQQDSTAVERLAEIGVSSLQEAVEFVKNVAPELWEILLRQQYVYLGTITLSLVVGLVLLFISIRLWLNDIRGEHTGYDGNTYIDYEPRGAPGIIGIVGCVVSGVLNTVLLVVWIVALGRLFNPEYYALMTLLSRGG